MRKILSLTVIICIPACLLYAQSWKLTGNAATNPATNFIGTTDPQPLAFKVNNVRAGFISPTSSNVALGYRALISITNSNANNTGIGYEALYLNSTGLFNTAIGGYALRYNKGASNTATGSSALEFNNDGNYNTASGSSALYSNLSGSNNTATGSGAMVFNTSGYSNTATGVSSLYWNTTGYNNTASGHYAMYNNISGYLNTASGYYSMFFNNSGSYNTANGIYSMYHNYDGKYNTAAGYYSMATNSHGNYNSAFGTRSLYSNDASYNSAFGYYSLYNNTTGTNNIAIGYFSLPNNTTGNSNTAMGVFSGPISSNLSNTTGLGYSAQPTASNQVMLGNSSLTAVRTYGSIIWTSDGRFKKNIKENVPGLDFIKQLRPVTYNYDIHKLNDFTRPQKTAGEAEALQESPADKTEAAAITQKEKKIYTGFIAQEVEKLADKMGYDFSGVYKPQNDKDPYGLDYAVFVVTLVKAVQELSNKNDQLQQQIDELKSMLQAISINSLPTSAANKNTGAKGWLEQNTPNPFSSSASIRYHLPASVNSAQIILSTTAGNTVQTFSLSNAEGYVTIHTNELASGTYYYTLILDGKKVDSKKMMLVK